MWKQNFLCCRRKILSLAGFPLWDPAHYSSHTKAAEKEMVTYKLLPYNYRIYFYKCESVPGKRLIKLQKISVSICFKYVCVMAEIWLSSQTLTYLLIFNITVLFIIWKFHAIHPGHTYFQCLPGQLSHPCPFPLKEEKKYINHIRFVLSIY